MTNLRLLNEKNDVLLAESCKLCTSVLSKAIGLMFTRKTAGKSLLFDFFTEKRVSLHMWFVFYPIDVLYIDKSFIVMHMIEGFKPFTAVNPAAKARYVLELPSGSINSAKVNLGDKIRIHNLPK